MRKFRVSGLLSAALAVSIIFTGCTSFLPDEVPTRAAQTSQYAAVETPSFIPNGTKETTQTASEQTSATSGTDKEPETAEASAQQPENTTASQTEAPTTVDYDESSSIQASIDASIAESAAYESSVAASIAESEAIERYYAESKAQYEAYIAASIAQSEAAAAAQATIADADFEALSAMSKALSSVDKDYWVNFRDPKTIYLTFDDGPSEFTPQILDILDAYGVKATFFVCYKQGLEQYYKDIVNRGHNIGVHAYNHNATNLYSSYEAWLTDFVKMYNYIYDVTGVKVTCYRFPHGSNNSYLKNNPALKIQIINYLDSIGVEYFDWNVTNGDGEGQFDAATTIEYATSTIQYRLHPVVLMHDSPSRQVTVLCLPTILTMYIQWGYKFDLITPMTAPIHQGPAWDY